MKVEQSLKTLECGFDCVVSNLVLSNESVFFEPKENAFICDENSVSITEVSYHVAEYCNVLADIALLYVQFRIAQIGLAGTNEFFYGSERTVQTDRLKFTLVDANKPSYLKVEFVSALVSENQVYGPNPKCRDCGLEADSFEPDPYAYDVRGDDTPEWLCDNCRHDSAMDI